jgi:hypothetical protein
MLLTEINAAPSPSNCSSGAVPSSLSSASTSSACGHFGMYSSHLSFGSLMTFLGHEMNRSCFYPFTLHGRNLWHTSRDQARAQSTYVRRGSREGEGQRDGRSSTGRGDGDLPRGPLVRTSRAEDDE